MQYHTYGNYGSTANERLALALAHLAELAPAMVSAEHVAYDPELGLMGTVVVQFGPEYSECLLPDPEDVADLVERMNEETTVLLDHQDAMREIHGEDWSLLDDHWDDEYDEDDEDDWDDEEEYEDEDDAEDEDDDWDDPLFGPDEEVAYDEADEADEADHNDPTSELLELLNRDWEFAKGKDNLYTCITMSLTDADEDDNAARKEAVDRTMRVANKLTGLDTAGVDEATISAVEKLVNEVMDYCEADPEDAETLLMRIKGTIDEIDGSMTAQQREHCDKVSSDTAAKLQALFEVIGK